MKKLYIIKTGITFSQTKEKLGDFDKWVIDTIANKNLTIEVIDIRNNQELPKVDECLGVIITGAHEMVSDELPWSVKIEKWIPTLIEKNIPLLGICYGHQLLAKSMQGVSGYHPNNMEIGTVNINLSKEAKTDKIFSDLPDTFLAHTVHSQTVLKLPKDTTVLAFNQHDKHHAIRIKDCAWGVQFHPEYNTDIMRSYIKEVFKKENISNEKVSNLLQNVQETRYSAKVLKNFARFCILS